MQLELYQLQLIGELRVRLPLLKIKELVDRVGLLPLLLSLKQIIKLWEVQCQLEGSLTFLRNMLSNAQLLILQEELSAHVVVVLLNMLSHSLLEMECQLKLIFPIQQARGP